MRTPRQRWGTCCPFDPECEHSFMEADELTAWMDTPISDKDALDQWCCDACAALDKGETE